MSTPTLRTPQIELEILSAIATGQLIKDIVVKVGININTLYLWTAKDPSFHSKITQARQFACDLLAEQLLTIPDTYDDVNKARLKCDSIKWYLSKIHSAQYGDRMELNINQVVSITDALSEARNRSREVFETAVISEFE